MNSLPKKAKEGEPCTGCGSCCAREACQLSVEFLESHETPCIALRQGPYNRLYCAFVVCPHQLFPGPAGTEKIQDEILGRKFAEMLGVGKGCDAED